MIKILNLYACLGGNRYKWDEVLKGMEYQIVAVELDPELAKLYQERFPNDIVIVADAHQYLLDHFSEFDFIWSSPPCPTHSKIKLSQSFGGNHNPAYPDMKLYQEIIFLKHYFKGKYCVENVISYYNPLIQPQKRGRHYYWANFILPNDLGERKEFNGLIGGEKLGGTKLLCKLHDYDFYKYKGPQRTDKIARNLVDYEAGKTILERALNIKKQEEIPQGKLFNL